MVSGLSTVASEADVLWVCAALSDADRAAARDAPGGRLGLDGTPGGSGVRLLDIPEAIFDAAYNAVANSALWFIHHMLYDTPNQPAFGTGFRRDWESLSCLQRRVRRGAGRRRRSRGRPVPDPGGGAGLSPLARPAHAG